MPSADINEDRMTTPPSDPLARLDGLLRLFGEKTMNGPVPTFAGWYPDPDTGGTKYWDGSRWTGDTRPRRRPFAPAASSRETGGLVILMGVGIIGLIFMGVFGDHSIALVGLLWVPWIAIAAGVVGVYLLRGQGPTTAAVEKRLAERREAVEKAENQAAKMRRRGRSFIGVNIEAPDVAGAAQVNAVANPETARALQNLQNLLYTQAISDDEYQAAKDKLLGVHPATADSFAQITKLVELHRAGVLSDVEFAAAKARALGL